ncbi:MAG: YeaH/YhbH family protein [Rhodobacteraceae bacterium]|nr:YeaH/YhbH family protein [Paracoccaceae bacterium]
MHHFIDRRPNPKGKSLGNRQRFLRRARQHVKEMVDKSVRDSSIKESSSKGLTGGERITIPAKGIREPRMVLSNRGGLRRRVFPGNKEFVTGDSFPRPNSGAGSAGRKASEDGDGEDEFSFMLTKDEYLELLFEGLELPDLIKKNMHETETVGRRRAGITTSGTPANLNLIRTMRNSLGRRLALQRPSLSSIEDLKAQIEVLKENEPLDDGRQKHLAELQRRLEELNRRRKVVGYIDPLDLRFDTHVPEKIRNSKAVVFCLMDVSGSMQEREKDIAKRFFLLLHLFLERRYERTDIVFVRHTHHAQEVDEETFFYARESGGTVVSTALEKMHEVILDRYPTDEWNIYGAQASDGENLGSDSQNCEALLHDRLLPVCQYYAYVEIGGENEPLTPAAPGANLWQTYLRVKEDWSNFKMQRVSQPAQIYPVFRELFSPEKSGAVA